MSQYSTTFDGVMNDKVFNCLSDSSIHSISKFNSVLFAAGHGTPDGSWLASNFYSHSAFFLNTYTTLHHTI
jgi:hypothetical protein